MQAKEETKPLVREDPGPHADVILQVYVIIPKEELSSECKQSIEKCKCEFESTWKTQGKTHSIFKAKMRDLESLIEIKNLPFVELMFLARAEVQVAQTSKFISTEL